MYINDAINHAMTPEQVLYYSDNCFGTADAISFRKERVYREDGKYKYEFVLRIHDLKTGTTPAHMEQLMIYAAIFCLEYHYDPNDIKMELRIYQNNEIIYHVPEPEEISEIMAAIVYDDNIISEIKES